MRLALLILLSLLLPAAARADLSPMLYLCWARQAPEALELRVERIRTQPWPEDPAAYVLETATLKVLAVRRTGTGLRPGDLIEMKSIWSKTPRRRMPGPAVEPRLQRGQSITAFMERAADGKTFITAAHGLSFDRGLWESEADPSKRAEPSC